MNEYAWANKGKWVMSRRRLWINGESHPAGTMYKVKARRRYLVELDNFHVFRIDCLAVPTIGQIAGKL